MTESEGCVCNKIAAGAADEASQLLVEGGYTGHRTRPACRNADPSFSSNPPPTSVIPGLEPGIQPPRVCAVNEPHKALKGVTRAQGRDGFL
ncbi:hypothetical protein GGI59_000935 [Rhizobium lentis]|uniref:Uncharacterized protein n=1 Tax=Rhizobium lentis TaxID=1138194 RepID=A0A7W8XE52_9HYPH|nr:hypothetical protein [Rhizobium lentis]MBB5548776.1 hypothetical protein [Rhizobium lentis]MBB5559308.1 hypothetical protein [Rhizobium lentis]MBB5565169.1 hypothetical protein [Rhizobium lentis]